MSIIEQAARRLTQLREAGIEVADVPEPARPTPPAPAFVAPRQAPVPANSSDDALFELVALDLGALAAANYMVPNHTEYKLEREFRAVKQPLLANAFGASRVARGNLIFVTSALPGEGKTFCTINLALSMAAEIDKTVLLIDADVAKPSIATRLGLQPHLGLLDLLSNRDLKLHDVVLRTNIPKLSVMQSGAPRANSAELLASGEMKRLLEEVVVGHQDKIILLDGPPLLPTIEARILAQLTGQVLMVVQSGKTTHDEVAQAFATVEKCEVVLSVLNRRSGGLLGGARYGYGY